jgi:hypothetical protein
MPNDFLERFRDQLHLSVEPARRRIPVVVLKPRCTPAASSPNRSCRKP